MTDNFDVLYKHRMKDVFRKPKKRAVSLSPFDASARQQLSGLAVANVEIWKFGYSSEVGCENTSGLVGSGWICKALLCGQRALC
jgi:hypothetical protein